MLPKKTSPNISKNYSNRKKKGILKRFDLKLMYWNEDNTIF